jgi:hypothetical protein
MYLSNATLGELRGQALLPKELLLEGALERLSCMDKHAAGQQQQQQQQGHGAAQHLLGAGLGPLSLGSVYPQQGQQQQQQEGRHQGAATQPRPTYCCNISYGLPGGSRYLHVRGPLAAGCWLLAARLPAAAVHLPWMLFPLTLHCCLAGPRRRCTLSRQAPADATPTPARLH